MPRPVLPVALVTGLALSGLTALAQPASAASPDLVISQVYGGGGNSGAPYTNDFIELQNRGTTPIPVDGMSVQYASAAGTSWARTLLSGTIAPGGFYLVQEAAGATPSKALPTPNATGTLSLSASAGKVALVTSTAAVKDLVGYGSTVVGGEGTPTPTLSNTTAALRVPGPDTDSNSADFTVGAPNPRAGVVAPPPPPAPPVEPCTVTATTAIPAIQGSGAASPLVGQAVTTRGVVVAATPGLKGFFVQDVTGDGDPATSDGLFVYAPSATVAVGDEVAVTGKVTEFSGLTEIGATATGVQKCGVAKVPAPTAYRMPEPVDDDLERVEGMSVVIPDELTVQQNFFLGRYGQLTLGSGGRRYQPTNLYTAGSPEAQALAEDNARALLVLDDASSAQNPDPVPFLDAQGTRRAGDTVTGLTGVLDEGPISSTSGVIGYRLQSTTTPAFDSAGRPAAPESVGGTLRAASFNVLNYFTSVDTGASGTDFRGANTAEEFTRQKAKIVAALAGLDADVVGLTEIQNNGPVAAQDLVDGLNAHIGAPGRWAVVPDPANGVGTDAIKVAQIYRTDRVERVGASLSLAEPNAFTGVGRNPVAQTYRQLDSREVTSLVINHVKSKGSCPAASAPNAAGNTDAGDGQGCWNAQRVLQAQALTGLVEQVQAAAADADVLLVGDFNAYGEEDPIHVLEDAGYVDLLQREIGPQAYSYVFDGLSGRLDHGLATPSLAAQVTGATEWHINADEPTVLDYNIEFNPRALYTPTPYRSSDHDPVLVGLALRTTPDQADVQATVTGPQTAAQGAKVTYTLTVRNEGPAPAHDLRAVLGTSGLTAVTADPATGTGSVQVGRSTVSGTRWTLTALGAGETRTYTVTGTVVAKPRQTVSIVGAAGSATPDPASLDNRSEWHTTVTR